MDNDEFFRAKTRDGTLTYFRRKDIIAVEEIPEKSHSEAYIKVYLPGFSFTLDTDAADILNEATKNTD